MEKSTIQVTLTHEDFVNSNGYFSNSNCALAVAIKRQMTPLLLGVGGIDVDMDGKTYTIVESVSEKCPIVKGYSKIREGEVVEPFTLTLQGR